MSHNDKTSRFNDRSKEEPDLAPIDVLMPTFDSSMFLEESLNSVFATVPVNRLLVCDGGSNDNTLDILKKYPRTEICVRPDIKTTGKTWAFLVSKVQTDWFAIIYSDIILPPDWYDQMCKHREEYDFFEPRRVYRYKYQIEVPNVSNRPLGGAQMARKEALRGLDCDDDYVHRMDDIFAMQFAVKVGYRYGKIESTYLIHCFAEEPARRNQPFYRFEFTEPKTLIDREKFVPVLDQSAKCIVKYFEPNAPYMQAIDYDFYLLALDREWIKKTGPRWLPRYDTARKMYDRRKNLRRVLQPMSASLARARDALNRAHRGLSKKYYIPEWFTPASEINFRKDSV